MQNGINKLQVRQHFSCHAEEYDRYARIQLTVAEQLTQQLFAEHHPQGKTLEVGCGTGMLSQQVLRKQPDLPLVLTDLAHGMSRHSQKRFTGSNVCDADAASLPFLAGSFDLVIKLYLILSQPVLIAK